MIEENILKKRKENINENESEMKSTSTRSFMNANYFIKYNVFHSIQRMFFTIIKHIYFNSSFTSNPDETCFLRFTSAKIL